jgi:thiosulfate dehydrogenase
MTIWKARVQSHGGKEHGSRQSDRFAGWFDAAGIVAGTALLGLAILASPVKAEDESEGDYKHKPDAQDFVHGEPEVASDAWIIAAGGRIYDSWYEALDRKEPVGNHPTYPKEAKQTGTATWRCKECHGWDYRGKDGIYGKGSHFTGFPGIQNGAFKSEAALTALIRGPSHAYTQDMINEAEMKRLVAFIQRGVVDMSKAIDTKTRKIIAGDPVRGRAVFQTVCAACHGFDGRLLDWGEKGDPAYIGTEGAEVPDEVLHKILNAHTGVQMINMRAFPMEYSIDVLAYTATLPVK